MKKIYLVILLFSILALSIPSTLALNSVITIKTEPFHTGILRVLDSNEENTLKTFYILDPTTDIDGEAQFEYSTSKEELSFHVIIKHPITKEIIDDQIFHDIEVKQEIYLDLISGEEIDPPEEKENENEVLEEETDNEVVEEAIEDTNEIFEEESNDEIVEEDIIEEEFAKLTFQEAQSDSGITGFFISKETGKIKSHIYYLAGAAILVVLILLFILRGPSLNMRPPHLKKRMSFSEELEDAEKKLEEARKEISDIKEGRHKITEAEEEFQRAKEKLEKLKKEEPEESQEKEEEKKEEQI
jgi:hypothetical protein